MRKWALARGLAACTVTALPVVAFAQPIVPPAPELTNTQSEQSVLRFDAGANIEHHSNVTGASTRTDTNAVYGQSKRSDTILRGTFGVNYDQMFSLQRLTLEARLDPAKYLNYSQFDYLGYSGRLNLDWAVGNALYGTLGVRAAQALTSVLANTSGGKNLERRTTLYGSAGLRLTPNWSAFVGADTTKLENSTEYFSGANNTQDAVEGGLRYAPGTGNEFSLVGRHSKGDYPNNQIRDSFGNLLPPGTSVNNSFKQNALLVRGAVQPSEDTRLTGEFGYTRRTYRDDSNRDYSGPTGLVTLAWRPSGAFYANFEVARDIGGTLYLSSNYIEVTELRFMPVVVLTGKLRLNGRFVYSWQNYKGDTGLFVGSSDRKDKVYMTGLQLAYEYSRGLSFTADVRRLQRSSNFDGVAFSDNVFGLGVAARF